MIAMAGTLLALTLAQVPAAPPRPAETLPDLLVEATIGTAGPYGELWVLRLTPNGDIFLRTYYSVNPSGSLMADFDVADEYMNEVRKAIEDERFFDLPTEISPEMSPLHQPDLQLEITLGGRKRKVHLYDPSQMKGNSNAKRFLAIWARLYEGLPLKPTW